MTLNPHLGYELGPGRSYNSQQEVERDIRAGRIEMSPWHSPEMNRIIQLQLAQDALRRYMIPNNMMYTSETPQARTEMKNWLRVLQDDIHTNHTRINALGVDPQHPMPAEDAKLMQTELHIRKLLADVLTQRASTEAAKQAMKG